MNIGVQLLKREKCCGVPLIVNGFIEQAKKQARVNLESLTDTVIGRDIPVVATSSSCTFTLRDEYPHLLDVDTTPVRDKVELATRYLYRLLDQGRATSEAFILIKPLIGISRSPIAHCLSHTLSYGENGLDGLYPGFAPTDTRC